MLPSPDGKGPSSQITLEVIGGGRVGKSHPGHVEKFTFPLLDPISTGGPATVRSGMLHVFEIDQPNRASFLQGRIIHTASTLSETTALMVKLVLEMRRMSWLVMEGDVLSVRDLPVDRRPTTLVAFLDTRDPAFTAGPHSNEGVGASRILNSAFEIEHAGRAVGMHLIRRRPVNTGRGLFGVSPDEVPMQVRCSMLAAPSV